MSHRRILLSLLCVAAVSPCSTWAQTYPAKPVRIVVGAPPGTGPDVVARVLAKKLSENWGNQGVIVDNKPGAGGVIAANEVARAVPDGYTLLLADTGQLSIAPHIYAKLSYNPATDFTPVSQVAATDFVLLVNPLVPARRLREFAEWAKQKQNGLFIATFGAGTPGHFGAYMLESAIGVKPEAVHYRSASDVFGGLVSGDVQGTFCSMNLAAPQVKSGKLVALGITGSTRAEALPEVPTLKEQGYPTLTFNAWFGIVVPAKTKPEIVAKLNADIVRALRSADTKHNLEEAGLRVTGTSRDDFARTIAADTATWGKAVAATGFKAE